MAGYKQAILLNPGHAEAHNNLATALLALGRIQDAVERYCQALLLQPDYAEALNNLAVALIAQGRIADGGAVLRTRHRPRTRPCRYSLQSRHRTRIAGQERMKPRTRYRHAILLKPDYAEAHNNLGNLLAAQNNTA